MKINKISPQKHTFVKPLCQIFNPPKYLFYKGILPENRSLCISIVGSRKPTRYGTEVTYKLAHELAQKGVVIVSGLALGIDSVAHKATLDAGGKTIAILANGLDTIYPSTNRDLGEKIINSGGAIISEYEPGEPAMRYRFLERNRLVSGLSDAIIVTEASNHSGTFATVKFALEQGREIFAVPGNITSPLSQGCNMLIKQGAHPVTSVDDILEVIAPDILENQAMLPLGNSPVEQQIIEIIQSGKRDGDEIRSQMNIDITELNSTLTIMEINGQIRSLGANKWTIK